MFASIVLDACLLAAVQGLLVALPRPGALARVSRVRSRAWALALPGLIVLGTFVPLALPGSSLVFLALPALAAPLLVVEAALGVIRGPRPLLVGVAVAMIVLSLVLSSRDGGEVARTALTALECLTIGVGLQRLMPARALALGVVAMCVVDVILLASGFGQAAAAVMHTAAGHFHGPLLDGATIGYVSIGFPDLLLAAVLGGSLAGHPPLQRRGAWLLVLLASVYGLLLPVLHVVPATVPIAVTGVVMWTMRRRYVAPRPAARPA